ncbi:MAG: SUMF1/EgtB/PvdO family nonheme iron enzyme [Planctomycetes bacterium]|nr:SUMF1/EgtB/PvdO family nonheme iron enzyme [Planctomycetota bacterium]
MNPYNDWLGISRTDQRPDHYTLLGLSLFESDRNRIEQASLERARVVRQYHIGAFAEQAQQLLNEIAAARVCLLDHSSKEEYDRRFRSPPQTTHSDVQAAVGNETRWGPKTIQDQAAVPVMPAEPGTLLQAIPPVPSEKVATPDPATGELQQTGAVEAVLPTKTPETIQAPHWIVRVARLVGRFSGLFVRTLYRSARWLILGPRPDPTATNWNLLLRTTWPWLVVTSLPGAEASDGGRCLDLALARRIFRLLLQMVFLSWIVLPAQVDRLLIDCAVVTFEILREAIPYIKWWQWGIALAALRGTISFVRWARHSTAVRTFLTHIPFLGPQPDPSWSNKTKRRMLDAGLRICALVVGSVLLAQFDRFLIAGTTPIGALLLEPFHYIAWWHWALALTAVAGTVSFVRWARHSSVVEKLVAKLRMPIKLSNRQMALGTFTIAVVGPASWYAWGAIGSLPLVRGYFNDPHVQLTEEEHLAAIPMARRCEEGTFKNCLGTEMVCILPGRFLGEAGGSSNWGIVDQPYWIAAHEVTVAEYLLYVQRGGSQARYPQWLQDNSPDFAEAENSSYASLGQDLYRNDSPIVGITLSDVQGFCQWLSSRSGEPLKYRLPTRAEWVCAYRAGSKNSTGSDTEVEKGTHNLSSATNGLPSLAPVGRFAANPWGLRGMAGNVWEMIEDERIVLGGERTSNADSEFSRDRSDPCADQGFRVVGVQKPDN